MFSKLIALIRAGEWWEHKLVPIAALFYATVLLLDATLAALWESTLVLLLALVPGAIYVSLLNDLADQADDARAGKLNRLSGRSRAAIISMLAMPIAAGTAFIYLWRNDAPLMASYLCAWTAFSLYSLPPFRLKARGGWGVVADAAGAHLFPSMVAVLLAFRATGASLDPVWLAATATWAFAYGLRGIIWHQLVDAENDRAAAVRTYVQRHSPQHAEAAVRAFVFPAELAALACILWKLGQPLPFLFLLLYLVFVRRRLRMFRMTAVIVAPKPRYLIWLHEYYDVFLPFALLASLALRHPVDLLVFAAHLLLFPRRLTQSLGDAWKLRPFRRARV